MPESTLSLLKADYESKVGIFLGWGATAWKTDPEKADRIKDAVNSGYRRFIFPDQPFNWSFLKPFATLTLVDGDSTIRMPDDFGGIEGRIAVSDGASGIFRPLEIRNPAMIEQMFSEMPDSTGRPLYASLRPLKGTTHTRGQRQELFVFPTADADYSFTFQYYLLPDCLTDEYPYAYGGAEHAETILESCLAIAEERIDDIFGGPHAMAFDKRLRASMAMDRRKKPQNLGTNRDLSDVENYRGNLCQYDQNNAPVTYTPGL